VEAGEQCDDGNGSNADACLNTCQAASCGDGFVWSGVEQCDDGNPSNSDACLATCEAARCGDGFLWAGVEECDDGNTLPGDGCAADCELETATCGNGVVEAGEGCDDGNSDNTDACLNTCQPASCGDGFVWAGVEQCDDANGINTDACLDTCEAARCGDGFVWQGVEQCDDGNPWDTDACPTTCEAAVCGDGFVWAGVEQCDDGNTTSGDGCSGACELEVVTCGNGVVEAGEACDDGNSDNTDACLNTCQPASCGDGFVWAGVEQCDDANGINTDGCLDTCEAASCGDGFLWQGVEQCDDGNPSNSDACLATCEAASCGDGFVWAGVEQCDDGNTVGGDGCAADCELETATCGNGVVETGESCDDGNGSNNDGCLNTCQPATCGDGYVWIGVEVCDDGNTAGGDGCAADCLSTEQCGNGVLDAAAGEVCDDGNTASGDGCSADCLSDETCGNGYLDSVVGETCDDGNQQPGDGCDASCQVEACLVDVDLGTLPVNTPVSRQVDVDAGGDDEASCGDGADVVVAFEMGIDADLRLDIVQSGDHAFGLYQDTGAAQCTDALVSCYDPGGFPSGTQTYPNLTAGRYFVIVEGFTPTSADTATLTLTVQGQVATCGNGTLEGAEVCDDGNTSSGDGCSADCLSDETCGNGYLDVATGEQCDDGNNVSGDGCSGDCLSDETCGNGVQDPGEVCDDGNVRSGDGCSGDCQSDETCGNGYVDTATGETCDDGNTVGGDGCDAFCHLEAGVCYVDEVLGILTPGVPVTRSLDVAAAGDEWTTGCSSLGPEVVLTFELDRPGDIDLQFWQSGDHAVGLYTEGQVSTTSCVAAGGVCLDRDPNQPGHVIFMGRPPGLYYLVLEGNGPGSQGTVDITLFVSGCEPDLDLGTLTQSNPAPAAVDTTTGNAIFEAGCAGQSGQERVVAFGLADPADLELTWSQSGDHVLSLLLEDGGDCDETPIQCHDPTGAATGTVSFPRLQPGNYLILVDAYDPGDEGQVSLNLTALPPTP
jgi:cysteine-rich repeat protein